MVELQKSIEDDLFAAQIEMEKRALVLLQTQATTNTPPLPGSGQHRLGNTNNNNQRGRKTLSSSVAYPEPSDENNSNGGSGGNNGGSSSSGGSSGSSSGGSSSLKGDTINPITITLSPPYHSLTLTTY